CALPIFAKARPRGRPSRNRPSPLRGLERSARRAEAVLLPLLDARVAGQELAVPERFLIAVVPPDERPSDSERDRARLRGQSAPVRVDEDIDRLRAIDGLERREDSQALGRSLEVILDVALVDDDAAVAIHDSHPRDGGLAPSGAPRE